MRFRRGTWVSVSVLFGACIVCLGTGFYTGRFYASTSQIASQERPQTRQLVAGSQADKIGLPDHGSPYYQHGTTVFSSKAKKSVKPVCTNTCVQAQNGVCDDGRLNPAQQTKSPVTSVRLAQCDLGTDCDDCGPWTPSGHAPWLTDNQPGPIARLREAGIQVRVREAGMELGFAFAYTDPKKDVDVSHHMDYGGVVEAGITTTFHRIFSDKCDPAKNGGKRGLVVDVGANFGWFSVLAASMGCKVIAFEPVPHFHAFLEFSVHLNGLAHLVDMRGNLISHISGSTLKMVVPSQGIWGTAGIEGLNIDQNIRASTNKEIEVPSQKLDDLIKEDVLLLKVDVEGWEWSVMQGAAQLIKTYNVENVMMEYSPGVQERTFRMEEIKATVQMLINLVDSGYRIAHLGDVVKHMSGGLTGPMPPMEEVTGHNLMYDLVDAELFSGQLLGCPIPFVLKPFGSWIRCHAMPEDPNPRSLRSLLGHNTNLWAAKGSKLQVLQGTVGILPLNAPANQYYVDYEGKAVVMGMGSRICKDLPASVQIRHRCPCSDKRVCGAEEDSLAKALAHGEIASNYLLAHDGTLVSGSGVAADVLRVFGSARKIGEKYKPGAVKGMLHRSAS